MFGKSKKTNKGTVPDFAPGDISEKTGQEYFERGARTVIERNRWFLISCILGIVLVAMSVSFSFLLPLKKVELFQITKAEGGRLVVDTTPVGNWTPDHDSLTYFLNQWANAVFDVNRSTIDKMITDSLAITVGNATDQLREFRIQDNPLVNLSKIPNYNRTYEFRSINFVKNDVALLRFRTITRMNDIVKSETYLMTITFILQKPETIEQVVKNPAGIYITNFSLSKESSGGDYFNPRSSPSDD